MGARFAALGFVVALLALLVGSGGCEAIVGSDVPAFTCSGTELAACPAGKYCKGAGCVACEKLDICDGLDNDCNGKIDDGPGSDKDGDTYTICGHLSADGKMLVEVDCNDNDPMVHPGAKEICNGVDDDCDGVIDEPSVVCPPDQVCAPRLQSCIPAAAACSPANCAPPKVCDPATQQCANPDANFDIGLPCASDKECKSGICGDKSTLGAAANQRSVCTKTCCTSDQCDAGFVCFAPGTGGKYCVTPALAGSRGGLGALRGGEACGTDPTRCRSGVCGNGKCVDTCCADSDCLNGTTCRLEGVTGHTVYSCGDPPGGAGRNSTCSFDSSCKSNFCANYDGFTSRCIATCCASTACGSITIFGTSVPVACIVASAAQTKGDYSSVCAGLPSAGAGQKFGDTCATGADCLSTFCETGHCTSVCCLDTDCPALSVCRPGTDGVLRCIKP